MASASPSHGSIVAAKRATGHGKLHKRASSATSPRTHPQSDAKATCILDPSDTAPINSRRAHGAAPTSKPRLYIDALTKRSSKDTNTIDLARSAAENESLTGLGILNYEPGFRSATDVPFSTVGRKAVHNRSTSLNSQFSTTSSSYRPPMRLTPRPYTPPSSVQDRASNVGSHFSMDGLGIPEEGTRPKSYRTSSMSSMNTAPKLHLNTSTSSAAPFTGILQTEAPATPASTRRSRRDTMRSARSVDTFNTASPSSRTSLDKAFSRIRGSKETVETQDPASRAASIRAARRAFAERQEAKDRKAETEELKAKERHNRKLERREASQRSKMDAKQQQRRVGSIPKETEKVDQQAFQPGRSYEELPPAHSMSLPVAVGEKGGLEGLGDGRPTRRTNAVPSKKRKVKSRYLRFLTWLKTRLLRLGRR